MPDLVAMTTNDGRFGYEAAGQPGALPLVFLHGIGGAARGWRSQLSAFGDRYHVIAWDMPGYGGSAPLASVSIATRVAAMEYPKIFHTAARYAITPGGCAFGTAECGTHAPS